MSNRRITSKELAKLAGVSSATISRAFAPDARINKTTRERVLSIAREHDYQPNAIARSLNNQRSRLVALVVNAIGNQCEAEELQELVHRLQARALLPIILCCGDYEDRVQLMRLASTYQVDHAVVLSDMVSLEDAVKIFRTARPIIVSFEPIDDASVSCIRIDGSEAAGQIVDKNRRRWPATLRLSPRQEFELDRQAAQGLVRRRACAARPRLRSRGTWRLLLQFGIQGGRPPSPALEARCPRLRQRRHGDRRQRCGASACLGGTFPRISAIVGQDGIAMAAWECHDLTTLALDHIAYIEAIVQLIEKDETDPGVARTILLNCSVRWGSTT